MSGLRRATIVFGIVSLLLLADGGYLLAAHDNVGGDTGVLFGNSGYFLNAGTVVVISGLLVLFVSVLMWLVDVQRKNKERERRSAAASPMVGNNRLADSGSICVGCHCLILPPVPPGATRGLRAAADTAGIPWPE